MTNVIRVEDTSFNAGTGGNGLGLLMREDAKREERVYGWYRDFLKRLSSIHQTTQNFNVTSSRGGGFPALQKYLDRYSAILEGQIFPVEGEWFSEKLKGFISKKEQSIRRNFLVPIPLSWDAPRGAGSIFHVNKMRFQQHPVRADTSRSFTIWNELIIVDVQGQDTTNERAFFSVAETGGTSWAAFNLFGKMRLSNKTNSAFSRNKSIFQAMTDDQAMLINIFGDVTIDGDLRHLVGSYRAYSMVIIHNGATLRVTRRGGEINGPIIIFGDGKLIE